MHSLKSLQKAKNHEKEGFQLKYCEHSAHRARDELKCHSQISSLFCRQAVLAIDPPLAETPKIQRPWPKVSFR